jgi:hypothetical protein
MVSPQPKIFGGMVSICDFATVLMPKVKATKQTILKNA